MKKLVVGLAAACALVWVGAASAGWNDTVPLNQVASSPTQGGGYPIPAGSNAPVPGTCRLGDYNSNRSESWIAVEPGTEDLVGVSKFFFETFSTFYDFHLGSYTMPGGTPVRTPRSPATTASRPGRRRCRRAGRTTPTRTSTSTHRAARTRRRCRSTRTGRTCTRTAGSVSCTATTSGGTGSVGNGGQLLDHLSNSTRLSPGRRRRQAVDCRQSRTREPVPGSRLRDVGDLQRQHGPDLLLEVRRPRPDLLQAEADHAAERARQGEHVHLPVGRCGR